jgi:4-oxalocrotonate tautomerase
VPRIIVQSLVGKTIDQKRELVRRVTDAVVEAYGVEPEAVSIVIDDIALEDHGKGGVLSIDRPSSKVDSRPGETPG